MIIYLWALQRSFVESPSHNFALGEGHPEHLPQLPTETGSDPAHVYA